MLFTLPISIWSCTFTLPPPEPYTPPKETPVYIYHDRQKQPDVVKEYIIIEVEDEAEMLDY